MIVRGVQILLMIGAAAVVYLAWTELNVLRGTVLFEYRHVLLVAGGFLVFSAAQAITGWIARVTGPDQH